MTGNEESTAPTATDADRELKAATRAAWALGDYHRFAKETVWELGEVLVRACGISRGQRVLDVAAGTGNTAIRAAETGADVVASDLTPENFEAGRREAEAHGVQLEWVEADAEALPFGDGEFDVVTSSVGALFAPDHQAVADQMLRVCRPGGTIGMINFTPEGLISDFFGALAPTCPHPHPSRCRRRCGESRSMSASCSATGWSRSR
jgi:ubiquinone/menaquinone biosynthesis C-methylase UbiE